MQSVRRTRPEHDITSDIEVADGPIPLDRIPLRTKGGSEWPEALVRGGVPATRIVDAYIPGITRDSVNAPTANVPRHGAIREDFTPVRLALHSPARARPIEVKEITTNVGRVILQIDPIGGPDLWTDRPLVIRGLQGFAGNSE